MPIYENFKRKIRTFFLPSIVSRSIDTPGTIGMQTLKSILSDSPTVIEIGAHIGTDTQKFAHTFPKGRVIAFEPHPSLYTKALKSTLKYSNVTIVPIALSNRNGFSIFRQSSGSSDGSGSLLEPTLHLARHPNVRFLKSDQIIVPVSTLDEYLQIAEIVDIELIWIDAQGAERMVFEGAEQALAQTKYVYCEISESSEYKNGATYAEIKELLAQYGLQPIREFIPPSWQGSGNVLFGRP